eukprot:GSA25T00023000001.1
MLQLILLCRNLCGLRVARCDPAYIRQAAMLNINGHKVGCSASTQREAIRSHHGRTVNLRNAESIEDEW